MISTFLSSVAAALTAGVGAVPVFAIQAPPGAAGPYVVYSLGQSASVRTFDDSEEDMNTGSLVVTCYSNDYALIRTTLAAAQVALLQIGGIGWGEASISDGTRRPDTMLLSGSMEMRFCENL